MGLAFSVTPPLSKRFSLLDVLCRTMKAAPKGPPSDTYHNHLVTNHLPIFVAPSDEPVGQDTFSVAAEDPEAARTVRQMQPSRRM
jgi:hypothetical protein